MSSVLSKIVAKTEQIDSIPLSIHDMDELKKAILDRIGCCIGARRLGLGAEVTKHVEDIQCNGLSTIWGSDSKTQPHLAAMLNGAMSSHLEYDSGGSMLPALIALAEQEGNDGDSVLRGMRAGYIVGVILRKLLASNIEKRGMHWPAYIEAFISSASCANLMGLTREEMMNAISIAASLSPAAPFETFTKGASVKDLYGGWGNMLGVQSVQLAKLGLTGPSTVFEGERGLFRNWLDENPDTLDLESGEIKTHVKPFPSCTAAHPTLSAVETLLREHPNLVPDDIEHVEVDTYRFGVDLSNESNPDTQIGSKVSIPFLTASMLVHGELLPEHTEEPWINNQEIISLARRVNVSCNDNEDELLTRKRYASVKVTLKNGELLMVYTEKYRWSDPKATQTEVEEKFRSNVGDFYPSEQVEEIITLIGDFEKLDDLGELTRLLCPYPPN